MKRPKLCPTCCIPGFALIYHDPTRMYEESYEQYYSPPGYMGGGMLRQTTRSLWVVTEWSLFTVWWWVVSWVMLRDNWARLAPIYPGGLYMGPGSKGSGMWVVTDGQTGGRIIPSALSHCSEQNFGVGFTAFHHSWPVTQIAQKNSEFLDLCTPTQSEK